MQKWLPERKFHTQSFDGLTVQHSAEISTVSEWKLYMKDKTTSVLFKAHSDSCGCCLYEPGEVLVIHGTECATPCPKHSFLSAANAGSSNLWNSLWVELSGQLFRNFSTVPTKTTWAVLYLSRALAIQCSIHCSWTIKYAWKHIPKHFSAFILSCNWNELVTKRCV